MSERLTFNLRGTGRELRDRITWVEAPARGTLSDAAAPYLPPLERPNWGFWGVFAFTALLFFRPQDTIRVLAPLHLPDLVAIAALGAMIAHRMNRGLPLVKLSPEILGVGALAAVMLLTVPFSVWPGGALGTFTDVYFKVVLIFILMVNSIKGIKALQWFNWLILSAVGYVAARGVVDYATGNNLLKGRLNGSISGLMGNPNDLAMNMVTFVPLAVMIAITRGRKMPRAVAAVIAVLMVATILFTKSRGAILGLAAVFIVVVIEGRKLRRGLGMLAVVGVLAATPLLPSWFWTRVVSITDAEQDESGSREARKTLMREGWAAFVAHPLTGVGAGQFKNYNPPDRGEPWRETHNVFLQIASELGIFGLLAFLVLVWQAAAALLWTRRMFSATSARSRPPTAKPGTVPIVEAFRPEERDWMRMHTVAMSASLAGWLVCAQFGSAGYYWTFYYLLALIVAARELTRDRFAAAHMALHPPVRPAWKERLTA
jgi:putative inorganic carbon (HCO3(-)) transporter